MQLHEVFTKTVDVLNTRGWCKGNCHVNGSNPVCIVIGIRAVLVLNSFTIWSLTGQDTGVVETYDKAIYTLARSIGVKHEEAIYEWNDAFERTKEQVTSHLLTLAAICKAQGDDSVSIEDVRKMKEESRRHAAGQKIANGMSLWEVVTSNEVVSSWVSHNVPKEKDFVNFYYCDFATNEPVMPPRLMAVHAPAETLEIGSAAPPGEVSGYTGLFGTHNPTYKPLRKPHSDATAPQA